MYLQVLWWEMKLRICFEKSLTVPTYITCTRSIYTTAQFPRDQNSRGNHHLVTFNIYHCAIFRGPNSHANQRERRESCRIFRQRHYQNHFAFHIMTRSGSYVTLPSHSSLSEFPHNRPTSFKIRLPYPIHLNGLWEVGLNSITLPDTLLDMRNLSKINTYML